RADLYRREEPTKLFAGTVTRTADALDPNTRTLLTEVQVANPKNELRPGMYLQVRFSFDRSVVPVVIPSAALATRPGAPGGVVLARAVRGGSARVALGRDSGPQIEGSPVLNPGQTVVARPGDDLPEGTEVEPVAPSR